MAHIDDFSPKVAGSLSTPDFPDDMPYDFESIQTRHGTDSQKWQKYR
jgi:hypothetical protein